MKRKIRILLGRMCIACFLAMFSMTAVYADNESDLENLKEQQNQVQSEKNETAAQLQKAQEQVSAAIAVIEDLDRKIVKAESIIQELDIAIEENLEKLEKANQDLQLAEEDEAYWYNALKQRIQMMYEAGNISYIEVLLQAESMSDLLSKWEYSRAVAEKDQEIMENLTASRTLIEKHKADIEEEEKILEQNREEEQLRREELEIVKEEKNAELIAIQNNADTLALYQQHLDAVEADIQMQIAETEKIIAAEKAAAEKAAAEKAAAEKAAAEKAAAEKAAAEKEAAEKAAAEKEAAEKEAAEKEAAEKENAEADNKNEEDENSSETNTQTPVTPEPEVPEVSEPVSSGFLWPVAGYSYISSPYGYRISPIYGGREFHRGIDIPAPSGTPIRASAAGTVITATYNSSYGNYVMISHADGYVTLYAHAVSLNVSAGQSVSAGDIVAYVGTTGDSTGNHLHFEVRLNGALQDPENYVSP